MPCCQMGQDRAKRSTQFHSPCRKWDDDEVFTSGGSISRILPCKPLGRASRKFILLSGLCPRPSLFLPVLF